MAINVGVIGLGMMGSTHLDVYSTLKGVKVVAISDADPKRLSGQAKASGNFEGLAKGAFDISTVRKYTEGMELINDPDVHMVDLCLPTHLHVEYGKAALKTGKHLLIEKPLARTYKDAKALADAADKAKGIAMCAMCMRFWPGWTWVKKQIEKGTYGKVLGATFCRLASHPGGGFYSNGELSGGAALDLHIHDTDFVQYLFGTPKAVTSKGYSKLSGATDHMVTHYHYDDIPLVSAEGGWVMADGFEFTMQFVINFEKATAMFGKPGEAPLILFKDGKKQAVKIEEGMGYEHEIKYMINCIKKNERPSVVTLRDAANAVRIVEAEVKSIATGKAVKL